MNFYILFSFDINKGRGHYWIPLRPSHPISQTGTKNEVVTIRTTIKFRRLRPLLILINLTNLYKDWLKANCSRKLCYCETSKYVKVNIRFYQSNYVVPFYCDDT